MGLKFPNKIATNLVAPSCCTSVQYRVDQKVLTPRGKAIIKVIDYVYGCVRVEHIDASTPVTDYRFSDLKPIKD